ncbi:NAD(P)-binding protein [Streptomyces sp. M19]
MTKALIIGGGIAGTVTAMALQKAGIQSAVYEARPRRRPTPARSSSCPPTDWRRCAPSTRTSRSWRSPSRPSASTSSATPANGSATSPWAARRRTVSAPVRSNTPRSSTCCARRRYAGAYASSTANGCWPLRPGPTGRSWPPSPTAGGHWATW